MNDSPDNHAPTDDFVEYLERDTMRRLRHQARFGPVPNELRSRARRFPTVVGMAAGVVMTLTAGMVLGASANYASAEVLPNGTTTIPSRPALAILPIRDALTAIGCTQPTQRATAATKPVPAAVAPKNDTTSAHVAASPASAYPDRAMIAAYARQYQPSVVRGDTTSEYIVMVLDATHKYVWSTHGTGNLAIEVGADARKLAERSEYNRIHQAEFFGATQPSYWLARLSAFDSTSTMWAGVRTDSVYGNRYQSFLFQKSPDSAQLALVADSARVRWRVRGQSDSVMGYFDKNRFYIFRKDSLFARDFKLVRGDSLFLRGNTGYFTAGFQSGIGCGRDAVGRGGRSGAADVVSTPTTYTNGWAEKRRSSQCNTAFGLQERGAGESGIIGLASANVSAADTYFFPAGELASHALRVMVVHLTAGTTWSGR